MREDRGVLILEGRDFNHAVVYSYVFTDASPKKQEPLPKERPCALLQKHPGGMIVNLLRSDCIIVKLSQE